MKKTVFIAGMMISLLVSCNRDGLYDCGREAREWAKAHVALYEASPRKSLVELPWARQRSVYAMLSSEKKVQLWQEKVRLVKEEARFSPEVIEEFEALFLLLCPNCYEDEHGSEFAAFDQAAKMWLERMEEVYQLSSEDIHFLAYTWTTEEEYYEARALDNPVQTKGDEGSTPFIGDDPVCECHDWHDCIRNACDTKNDKCKKPEKTCGVGGAYECTSMCL